MPLDETQIIVLPEARELTVGRAVIPAMSDEAIAQVYRLEDQILACPQTLIVTDHVIHGGMYIRTVMIPAGNIITGALIKVPTMLIVHGEATVYIGDEPMELTGYNVVPAAAGRKQAFIAKTDTWLTMFFATNAKNVDEAERHFTDEFDRLMSNSDPMLNRTTITGE